MIPSATLRTLAKKPTRAANTVFGLYSLVRKRLRAIGYFPDTIAYENWLEDSGASLTFASSSTARQMHELSYRMQGASEDTRQDRLAELYFLAEDPHYTAEAMFRDIKLIIRVTGPLNREPINMDLWTEHHYALSMRRMIAAHRRRMAGER